MVNSQFIELVGRGLVRTTTKSWAGARTITVPAAVRSELVEHQAIADRLSGLIDAHRGDPDEDDQDDDDEGDDGAAGALVPAG